MRAALEAYLTTLNGGASHHDAVVAAAYAVRSEPWEVVQSAGLLARCRPAIAPVTTGLTPSLRRVPMGSRAAVVSVKAGQSYPVVADKRRYGRGVHDPPVDLARRVVEQAIAASDGQIATGMDIACGPGAFLVALAEAGVTEIYGVEADALCLAVAAIACPRARLLQDDAVKHGPPVDLLVGGPPYVPRLEMDARRRFDFRHRFPWLGGVLDPVAGFAAAAAGRVRPGGGLGIVLPTEALVLPHGSPWRRRFVERHHVYELVGPMPFPGSSVDTTILVAQAGSGPGALPAFGLAPAEALAADNVVLDPERRPGDAELLATIRAHSVPLGTVARVSAGITLVEQGQRIPSDLVTDRPGEGRVPFAETRRFFAGEHRYLLYKPARLHRATERSLHEDPKVVVQRSRRAGPIRAEVDRAGIYVGDSLTVVAPEKDGVDPDPIHELLTHPALEGWLRVHYGRVTDLTPRILASIPFPKAWNNGVSGGLAAAWGVEEALLEGLAHRGGH